jgi:hypothetical protein
MERGLTFGFTLHRKDPRVLSLAPLARKTIVGGRITTAIAAGNLGSFVVRMT